MPKELFKGVFQTRGFLNDLRIVEASLTDYLAEERQFFVCKFDDELASKEGQVFLKTVVDEQLGLCISSVLVFLRIDDYARKIEARVFADNEQKVLALVNELDEIVGELIESLSQGRAGN